MNSQATEIHNPIDKDIEASYSKSILHKSTDKKTDKDLLISIILHSKWSDFNSIIEMSKNELKQLLVTELSKRTNETSYDLYRKTNLELSSFCLLYTFLKTAAIRTESELKDMSFLELRNSLIIENTKNLELNISTLQTLSTKKLVQLGYSWYLPKTYKSLINFDVLVNSTSLVRSKFKLKDDLERPMNVIKIVKTNEDTLNNVLYIGVYHVRISKDNFNLQLAGSNDLFNWSFITEIDQNDGFVHLSTSSQLSATLSMYFKAPSEVMLLQINFNKVETAYFESKKVALMTILENYGKWDKSNVIYQDGEILDYNKKINSSRW